MIIITAIPGRFILYRIGYYTYSEAAELYFTLFRLYVVLNQTVKREVYCRFKCKRISISSSNSPIIPQRITSRANLLESTEIIGGLFANIHNSEQKPLRTRPGYFSLFARRAPINRVPPFLAPFSSRSSSFDREFETENRTREIRDYM